MKNKIQNLITLFSITRDCNIEASETWESFECHTCITLSKAPTPQELINSIPEISNRDNWRLIIKSEYESIIIDLYPSIGSIEDVYEQNSLEPYLNESVKVSFVITKSVQEQMVSVYDESIFTIFIRESKPIVLLNSINNRFNQNLFVEVWKDNYAGFHSNTICFIPKGGDKLKKTNEQREARIKSQKLYCQSNIQNISLLPDDLYTDSKENELSLLFRKVCAILSMVFVCDNSILSDNVEFCICGYKTLRTQIHSIHLKDIQIDDEYCDRWFEIYDWAYTGGYTLDRLSISRNIISLNCTENVVFRINTSTFRSIKSNFKVFEQDNVRQYIKVRNEISNLLISMQREINTIVDGFASDFKKNILAVFTFFLTVVVVRVISKGDFTGGFTTPVFLLSLIFLFISILLLNYSRQELKQKEKLFTKHYDQIKERYRILLSDEEMREMFEDSNPNKLDSHANYIKWQRDSYTKLWIICIILLALFVLFAWASNIWDSILNCKLIKVIIQCCLKNI